MLIVGNSDMPYEARVKTIKNDGEYLFEKYCREKGCQFHKIGFDEHNQNVPYFWRLNDLLRNLPDYVINVKNKTYVVCVKGTDKLKRKEFFLLDSMNECFGSKEAPLLYAFCFKENSSPIWRTPDQIYDLYENSVDEVWHDGVVYRNLKIRGIH